MFLLATVIAVERNALLVFDLASQQRVRVITPNPCCLTRGSVVRIQYNGVMTKSIPPQITAQSVTPVLNFRPRF